MAMKLDLSTPGQFKMLGGQTNLAQKWDQYVKRFEYYIKAQNVTKDEQKRALLFHVAGEEVQDLFEMLQDTGTTYAEALGALNTYFEPKKSIAFERHLSCLAKHKTKKQLIISLCACRSYLWVIWDQVVDCCKSTELRKKLLSESELTLHKIPTVSRMFELSSSHAEKMAENNQTLDTKSGEINRLNGANVNKPCHVTPTGTTQRRETNVRLDIIRIGRITLATRRRARERQGNVTNGLQLNAIVAEEKVTMVGSVNVLKNVICRDCGRRGHFARMCKTQVKNVNVIDDENVTEDNQFDEEILVLGKQDATVSLSISGK